MNPAGAIATALLGHVDPAYASLIGSIGLIVGMFAAAGAFAALYAWRNPE